jgi:uracil-DNA glycosylase family 4
MEDRNNRLAAARNVLLQRLETLHRAGVEQIGMLHPRPLGEREQSEPREGLQTVTPALSQREREPLTNANRESTSRSLSHSPPPAASMLSALLQPYPSDVPDAAGDRQQLLAALSSDVRACTLCRDLACSRKQTVFGVGNARPRVAFFGEAPGADEDRQGEPFVGRAGQLLTKIIEACGWQRSDVYIMNVLKCRPPENRNPLPNEVENCRPFFKRQFEILRPEYIVCVGTVPAQALLETTESVGKLRGRWHRYRGSKVLVTYHPSYLLRNPSAKKYVWDDMQMLLKEMGLAVPKRSAS